MIVVDLASGLGITEIKSFMLTVELIQNITCIDYVLYMAIVCFIAYACCLEKIGDELHGLGEDRGWTSKPDLLGGDRGWTPVASLICVLIDNSNIAICC